MPLSRGVSADSAGDRTGVLTVAEMVVARDGTAAGGITLRQHRTWSWSVDDVLGSSGGW
jgi:hypothetical protein